MNVPDYLRTKNLKETLVALDEYGERARILAGGTDLLVALHKGNLLPEVLLDISLLDELRGIRLNDGFVEIGALTTHSEIRNSQDVVRWAPPLVTACREIGSMQIRNLGTLGGNLANASPAGDTIPPLYGLDAQIHLVSLHKERWISINDFFTGPGKTVRLPGELIAGVRFLPFLSGWKGFFSKIGQRRAVYVAKVSAAGVMKMDKDRILSCRLVLGAVAPTVIRLKEIEELLCGNYLSEETIRVAAQLAEKACSPINDIRSTIEYRRNLAGVLINRGLTKIFQEIDHE